MSRMEAVVILSRLEQEYLLRSIEAGLRVASAHQLFLWAQGQLQALLPHQVLACLQFAPDGALRRIECVHGSVLGPATSRALAGRRDGLALRIARHCVGGGHLPALFDGGGGVGGAGEGGAAGVLDGFGSELDALGIDSVLVHGTGHTSAGASVFVLFGLPMRPGPRHAYFLELLLPYLHLALGRLPAAPSAKDGDGGRRGAMPRRSLSARETEIVGWLREGKSNGEMGQILGISGLTVKNHLQRIYRALGVSNRAHALARCLELRLLES
jgi:transcriptional regulator EpsA